MKNVNNEINKYGIVNPDYINLTKVKLTRKIIKQPIMTKVHNVTIYGICDQLKNNLEIINIDNKVYYRWWWWLQ